MKTRCENLCQLISVPLNTFKTCNFPYFSSLQDSKLVRYIRIFVLTEFVVFIKFYKLRFVKNFAGDSKKLGHVRDFAKSIGMFALNKFTVCNGGCQKYHLIELQYHKGFQNNHFLWKYKYMYR